MIPFPPIMGTGLPARGSTGSARMGVVKKFGAKFKILENFAKNFKKRFSIFSKKTIFWKKSLKKRQFSSKIAYFPLKLPRMGVKVFPYPLLRWGVNPTHV